MTHVLFMNDRILEVFPVSLEVFPAHFFRVEYVYFCFPVADMLRKRSGEIGTELILHAFSGDKAHVISVTADH